jgi:hypothetical protein
MNRRIRGPRGNFIATDADEALASVAAAGAGASPPEPQRPPVRPEGAHEQPMRAESSRERADRRAAEIMGHLEGALDEGQDELALDQIAVPEGWSYEWKRQTVFGKSDPAYDTKLARTGWEPVPADRHPAMMPKDHRGAIERDGLILMERPKVITDRVRQIMNERARNAVRLKEQQLNDAPQGTFERVDERGRPTARVKTSHSPVEIAVPTE